MTFPDYLQLFQSIFGNQSFIIKGVLIILLFLYSIFSLIVMLQIQRLNEIVNQLSFSPLFKFLAVMHSLAAVILLILTVISL